jgi:diguanylate cyclase (GGDEF)-like protein
MGVMDGLALLWAGFALAAAAAVLAWRVNRDLRRQHAEARREVEASLLHDELTGLPNRRRFQEELGSHMARARRSGWQGALIALELDAFETVSEAVGEQLVRQASETLQGRLRSSDFVARLGGAEFAVLMHDADVTSARIVASALVTALTTEESGDAPATTASIGIALIDGPTTGEELMIRAGVALDAAKDRGGSSFALYSPTLDRHDGAETGGVGASERPD